MWPEQQAIKQSSLPANSYGLRKYQVANVDISRRRYACTSKQLAEGKELFALLFDQEIIFHI